SRIADMSAPVDAAAGCRPDSAGSPAAPRWRRSRRAASMHRAPHPAWPYFPSVLDSIKNVMEYEALCVVRTRSYLFTYGLDVMGAIITQGVRGCTWHRFTALLGIAL